MNSLKNRRKQLGNMKITSDLTNLTTAILILTVQMFFERTLCIQLSNISFLLYPWKWTRKIKAMFPYVI
jgi:uncharacterized protein HemY